jgi:gold/copper resistance efflux pump
LFLTPVFYVVMRGLSTRFERHRSRSTPSMEESTS